MVDAIPTTSIRTAANASEVMCMGSASATLLKMPKAAGFVGCGREDPNARADIGAIRVVQESANSMVAGVSHTLW